MDFDVLLKMTLDAATKIAQSHIDGLTSQYPLSLFHGETAEIKNGWVFFYQSTRFVETGDRDSFLFGNAPLIVDSNNGTVHVTGTSGSIDSYIKNFEETGNPHIEGTDFVRLTGWREGAQKIEGTKSIRALTDLGLGDSKRCIDDALAGRTTDIPVRDTGTAIALQSKLDHLGWTCEVIRGLPK